MEFDGEERYACAALFTLALHLCQAEASLTEEENTAAWGQTAVEESDCMNTDKDTTQRADIAAAEWSAFWGWDCCGPSGILEHMYSALAVPQKSWPGLKRLPEVGGVAPSQRQSYLQLVSSYINNKASHAKSHKYSYRVLDKNLPSLHIIAAPPRLQDQYRPAQAMSRGTDAEGDLDPERRTSADIAAPGEQVSQGSELVTDSDSDLECDLASARLQKRILRQCSLGKKPQTSAGKQMPEGVTQLRTQDDDVQLGNGSPGKTRTVLCEDTPSESEGWSSAGEATVQGPGQEEHSAGPTPNNQEISEKAIAAVWHLVEASVDHRAHASDQHAAFQNSEDDERGRTLVGGMPPKKQWYDARQRCSIRLLAQWLRIPWKIAVNFECLMVYRLLMPAIEAGRANPTSWERSVRAAKIGAAALGIGAVFALTGGLAAPAIASGVGAAIGLAGGSAATATGVTAFLGTGAGGAVVASAVGAAGSGLSLPHLAHRIGKAFQKIPSHPLPRGP